MAIIRFDPVYKAPIEEKWFENFKHIINNPIQIPDIDFNMSDLVSRKSVHKCNCSIQTLMRTGCRCGGK